ncbi:TPA: sodium/glutamate symporter [Acinetobacter baumannii]|jgi:ESS family glutamate:Na+ symporter|uniref:Sodium/glutamate symporter n=58 Tax=Acinetobacter baumannii TaxID=470 RepID=D0C5S4_ACIB2|nr:MULTISPECIES: sodium/glutamate symporter [Acinetobacter]ADX93041.1 Na+/glutamate symporter [Acinetobacter baumannii TCDC-AB0715]AHX30235.1 sodium:glutamate symporter [Acinetobacter baumannii AC12]AHX63835.1 sodium:glutamate symporter [Acinetobacter baumannii AC30]EMT97553.1 sodium/glutamate symport carrier protein [Acinetobacter baumannii ABNIH6]EMU10342.1 sodium/glutamate symport carrier protein [Acinetobacter baumannii ABNIH10]ETY68898.1 sodium:glutamate symporter [Acinetobacter baumanni
MEFVFNGFYTLISAVIVLLLGRFLVNRIDFLKRYNIPEPVAGGLVAAVVSLLVHTFWGYSIVFSSELQTSFMLVFFASIGLSANFMKLKEGGTALVIFLICVASFIVVQNAVGMSLATLLGLDPLIGLIAGSITLTGGHGTAGAWGEILESQHGIQGALALGMASATFGLIIGGVIGGPLAKLLINRYSLAQAKTNAEIQQRDTHVEQNSDDLAPFENPHQVRLITADNAITTLGMFAACLAFAEFMTGFSKGTWFELPTFVWALGGGVILRNILESVLKVDIFDRAIDVFGNASLSLYLAMALLSLKLWQLADLAGPLVVILGAQTLTMALYAAFVTFRVMGKNYDAAVLAAGHCGFGMGATPTAVANMQAITNMYGPSHKAFLIVPLCGAFFVDLINATVIQLMLKFIA